MIERIEPRRNSFSRAPRASASRSRSSPRTSTRSCSSRACASPSSHGLVDRVLAQAAVSGIPAVLVINKTDSGEEREALDFIAEYAPAHRDGFALCAKSGAAWTRCSRAAAASAACLSGIRAWARARCSACWRRARTARGRGEPPHGQGPPHDDRRGAARAEPGLQLIDTPGVRCSGSGGTSTRSRRSSRKSRRTSATAASATAATTELAARCARPWNAARSGAALESFRHLREELGETR